MYRRFATAALCLVLAACLPVQARPLVEIGVVDRDRGEWLAPIRHRGQDWIEGEPGHRYGVRLTNTTGGRVLVVLSVDGVNAVTGQTAHPSQAGYVLEPWETTEIDGWRKSFDDIAQFVFTALPDSYAARTGRPDNVGVIGVAVFEEARPAYYEPDYQRDDAPAAAEARAQGQPAPQTLGTGHGAREWSPVTRTGFDRATRAPVQITQVRYDDYRSLVAQGVLPRHRAYRWQAVEPDAFPGGFVADPPR